MWDAYNICKKCYEEIFTRKEPVTVEEDKDNQCAYCGELNRDGIYVQDVIESVSFYRSRYPNSEYRLIRV